MRAKPVSSRPLPKVRFQNESCEVEVPVGTTLLVAAQRAGVDLHRGFWAHLHCRGIGLCGSCKVWAFPSSGEALSPPGLRERLRHTVRGALRLGCVARVQADVEVRTKPGGPAPEQTLEAYRVFLAPGDASPPLPQPKSAAKAP